MPSKLRHGPCTVPLSTSYANESGKRVGAPCWLWSAAGPEPRVSGDRTGDGCADGLGRLY